MPALRSGRALLRGFASARLTVVLLLVLAVVGGIGTLLPQTGPPDALARYPAWAQVLSALGVEGFYTSWFYRGLLALLAANLGACAVRRSGRDLAAVFAVGRPRERHSLGSRGDWEALFAERGLRLRRHRPLVAARRPWAAWGFPLVHWGPFLVMGGALWGSVAGEVLTSYVRQGEPLLQAFSWEEERSKDLPFALVVEDIRLEYYPIGLRVGWQGPDGDKRTGQTQEGGELTLAGTPFTATILDFDPRTRELRYRLSGPGGEGGGAQFSSLRPEESPVPVVPVAYRDLETRRVEVPVSLRGPANQVLHRAPLSVNAPLVYGGYRIFLTTWNPQPWEDPVVGLQIARSQGDPAVWLGGGAICLGLFVIQLGPAVQVREREGEVLVWRSGRGGPLVPATAAGRETDGATRAQEHVLAAATTQDERGG